MNTQEITQRVFEEMKAAGFAVHQNSKQEAPMFTKDGTTIHVYVRGHYAAYAGYNSKPQYYKIEMSGGFDSKWFRPLKNGSYNWKRFRENANEAVETAAARREREAKRADRHAVARDRAKAINARNGFDAVCGPVSYDYNGYTHVNFKYLTFEQAEAIAAAAHAAGVK